MQAVIFNSGLGKRMAELTKECHKSMVHLSNGETIFNRQIRILSECGIRKFVVTTGPFKEQLEESAEQYNDLEFVFVENSIYDKTNYIYSMYLAKDFLDEECLLMHGDLVFDKGLVLDMLKEPFTNSLCLVDKMRPLPKKDFKARIDNGKLREVGINIFDDDCYAFQPLYKLTRSDIGLWTEKVCEFIENGNDQVYAENALNTILHNMDVRLFSYENNYIDEVDTPEDLVRVAQDIRSFDFDSQEIVSGEGSHLMIPKILEICKAKRPMIVSTDVFDHTLLKPYMDECNIEYVMFTEFGANPLYEDVVVGCDIFIENGCDILISVGGGSSIDTAKCIKLFLALDRSKNFLEQEWKFSQVKHISIPTTCGTGSESTRFSVIYFNGEKQSIAHDSIIPEYAILVPELLQTIPEYHLKSSMMDTLCQAIESMWSINSTSKSQEFSIRAMKLALGNIAGAIKRSPTALGSMLLASHLAGKAINITQTTAPHAMSYKITSLYHIAHGHAVAVCIPHVWEYMSHNTELCKDPRGRAHLEFVFDQINEAFGCESTQESIQVFLDLYYRICGFEKLMLRAKSDLDIFVTSVNAVRLKNNPVPLDEAAIRSIYKKALN